MRLLRRAGVALLAVWAAAACAPHAVSDTYEFSPTLGTFERREFEARGVRAIWFSSASPPSGRAYAGRAPEVLWPPQETFERSRDTVVRMVFVLAGSEAQRIDGVLRLADGRERRFSLTVAPGQRSGQGYWHVRTYAWSVSALPNGRHTVHVKVDERVAGSYVFQLR
jgi:hypothetical protein